MDILGFGGWEIFLIILVALFVFGPGRMVEFARGLGKFIYSLKNTTSTLTAQINKELEEQQQVKAAKAAENKVLEPGQAKNVETGETSRGPEQGR